MLQNVITYLETINPILAALYATIFTWSVTALGAAVVFFFKKENKTVLDGMLGFTGGVMLAASVWSLIIPSINMTEGEGFIKVLPATVGIFMGALFLYVLDKLLPHFHANFKQTEGIKTDWQKKNYFAYFSYHLAQHSRRIGGRGTLWRGSRWYSRSLYCGSGNSCHRYWATELS